MNSTVTTLRQRMHWLVLLTWGALAVCVWLHSFRQGITLTALGWAVFFSLPLLICLPGLLKARRYTHKWATLCVLPYFVVGATEGVANPTQRPWALTVLGLSLLWFFALVGYLRITASDAPMKPKDADQVPQ